MIDFIKSDKIANFKPLSLSRDISSLKSGIFSIRERLLKYKKKYIDADNIVIKANPVLIDINFQKIKLNKKYYDGDEFLIAIYEKSISFNALEKVEYEFKYRKANYIWDYLKNVGSMIKKDLKLLSDMNNTSTNNFDVVGDEKNIYLGKNVNIYPGNVLDTTNGPIIIDDNTNVRSFSFIEGPTYIGKNCILDDAKIRGETYIGDVCKVSGEIENSIILSYTNKHHHGFLGHSYLGSWINLGANTTNSDLKNNYGEVKVYLKPGKRINTGCLKIGSFIGDHVKTGIGTLLNTGTCIGFGSLIYGGGMFPKFIPSFSWADNKNWNRYKLEKFIENEIQVMKRRDVQMSKNYQKKIHEIFKNTENEREWVDSIWQN